VAIAKRYPLYSKSDKVQWMLGDIFEKSEHKEVASVYYGNILKNYPLSPLAANAKNKLVAFKVPVPQADPKAVAWMTAEQNTPRPRESLVKKPLGLVRSGPHDEMIASAKHGAPNLEPESDTSSGTDILSGGNKSQLGGAGGGARNTAVVETVTPGGAAPAAGTEAPAGEAAPAAAAPESAAPAAATPPADANGGSGAAAPAATDSKEAPAAGSEQPAKADSTTGDSPDANASKAEGTPSTDDSKDSKKESSSKKKKGLKKLVPW